MTPISQDPLRSHIADAFTRAFDAATFDVAAATDAPPMDFKKNAIAFHVSREMALDFGLVEPTEEERAQRAADAATWRETRRMGHEQTIAYVAALDAIGDPLARAILDLHTCKREGDYPECDGCDFAGYEGEPPSWPCRTVDEVARHYDIEPPIYVTFEEPK